MQNIMEKELNIKEYNIKTLAYVGDAVYELYIREYLVKNSTETANVLYRKSLKYVSAKAQEYIMSKIYDVLTEEEKAVYKRGRNANSNTVPKNTDIVTYKKATGFECIVGYLYLTKQKRRLDDLMRESIRSAGERI